MDGDALAKQSMTRETERNMNMNATTIKLTNKYHCTEATLRVRDGHINDRQYRRALRKLCGMADCSCAGHTSRGIEIQPRGDGRYAVQTDL